MGQGTLLRGGHGGEPRQVNFPGRRRREDEKGKGGDITYLGDFAVQCRYAYDKIKRALAANGATFNDVVKIVTYVTDIRYQADVGRCRSEAFAGAPPPAHTLLNIVQLAWPGMLVEVDVTAATAK